jgi:hypothetical protein
VTLQAQLCEQAVYTQGTKGTNPMAARIIGVYCANCSTKLYRYKKGGKGSLVKCFLHKIEEDYTDVRATCPNPRCGTVFARPTFIKNKAANKIIGGKVFTRKR